MHQASKAIGPNVGLGTGVAVGVVVAVDVSSNVDWVDAGENVTEVCVGILFFVAVHEAAGV
jgi:hypothetical protein